MVFGVDMIGTSNNMGIREFMATRIKAHSFLKGNAYCLGTILLLRREAEARFVEGTGLGPKLMNRLRREMSH